MRQRRRLSESAIRYKLYETALMAGIPSDKYHAIVAEAGGGFFSKLANAIAKKFGSDDVQSMMNDRDVSQLISKTGDDIKTSIGKLYAVSAKKGVPKDDTTEWIKGMVDYLAKDAAKSATESESGSSGDSGGAQLKPGTPITSDNPEAAVSQIAGATAEALKLDPEKAKTDAVDKKVNVPKATQVLAKAIASVSKVDVGKVSKIIDYLVQNNHLLAEGRRALRSDVLSAARELIRLGENITKVDRINSLAGLLIEAEEVPKEVAGKFEQLKGELRKKFSEEEISDDELLGVLWRLDDLESIKVK